MPMTCRLRRQSGSHHRPSASATAAAAPSATRRKTTSSSKAASATPTLVRCDRLVDRAKRKSGGTCQHRRKLRCLSHAEPPGTACVVSLEV